MMSFDEIICVIEGGGRRGDSRPSLKELINDDVVQAVAFQWRQLGLQLLSGNSSVQPQDTLNIIEADHSKNVSILYELKMLINF